jgi:hypothetical protein
MLLPSEEKTSVFCFRVLNVFYLLSSMRLLVLFLQAIKRGWVLLLRVPLGKCDNSCRMMKGLPTLLIILLVGAKAGGSTFCIPHTLF